MEHPKNVQKSGGGKAADDRKMLDAMSTLRSRGFCSAEQGTGARRRDYQFVWWNAWLYSGSDSLWAGLIKSIQDSVDEHYGPAFAHARFHAMLVRIVLGVALLVLTLELFIANGTTFWSKLVKHKTALKLILSINDDDMSPEGCAIGLLTAMGSIACGLSAVIDFQRGLWSNSLALGPAVTPDEIRNKLGFMADVKNQIDLIADLLREPSTVLDKFGMFNMLLPKWMWSLVPALNKVFGIKTGKELPCRLIIVVDDLDRCPPDKCVEVLQSLVLLTENTPFVVLLAIDPRIVVSAIEASNESFFGKAGVNGYEYLNKIVQIPFALPPITDNEKVSLCMGYLGSNSWPRVTRIAASLSGNLKSITFFFSDSTSKFYCSPGAESEEAPLDRDYWFFKDECISAIEWLTDRSGLAEQDLSRGIVLRTSLGRELEFVQSMKEFSDGARSSVKATEGSSIVKLVEEADFAALDSNKAKSLFDGFSGLKLFVQQDIETRSEQALRIKAAQTAKAAQPTATAKKLIISTGDIVDVDGFCALAHYAGTGADVLFVLNYPAYLGVSEDKTDEQFDAMNLGLGYKYCANQVRRRAEQQLQTANTAESAASIEFLRAYVDLLRSYEGKEIFNCNQQVKSAMTDQTFALAKTIWEEAKGNGGSGQLFFAIGGIHQINPFSLRAVRNDLLTVTARAALPQTPLQSTAGNVYDLSGARQTLDAKAYAEVYIDFNGSMAFWDEGWVRPYVSYWAAEKRIKGAFVMGGVRSDQVPFTMPPMKGTLNRLSCATINQLYHPARTAAFFEFLDRHTIPVFIVTNNVIPDLTKPENADAPDKRVIDFMNTNGLRGAKLQKVALEYYNSPNERPPPRKMYDFYAALALTEAMADLEAVKAAAQPRRLFYSPSYGVALVAGKDDDWTLALANYTEQIKAKPPRSGVDFEPELDVLRGLVDSVGVSSVSSGRLAVAAGYPEERSVRFIPVLDVGFSDHNAGRVQVGRGPAA